MAKSKEVLRSLLMKVKETSEKSGLKLNIHKWRSWNLPHHIMANRSETMEIVTDFISLGFEITAGIDCSHELKRTLAPWKKISDKPRQHIKKKRHTWLIKVHIVKGMLLRVVVCGCQNWMIKKAECWRIDAFELWCWRRLLRIPWTAR